MGAPAWLFSHIIFLKTQQELAICLSKYAGEKDPMAFFVPFVRGFAAFGRLNEAEVRALPDLIQLRVLSNVVYFVGRALARESSIEDLTTRAQTYANRVNWLKQNAEEIRALVRAHVRSDAA